MILKKVKSKIFNVPILLFPLKYGVNNSEKNIFKNRLNNYIEVANLNKELDQFKNAVEESNKLYESMLDKTTKSLEKILSNTESISKIQ